MNRAAVLIFGARLTRMLAQAVILIGLARLTSPTEASQLTLAIAICSPVYIFAELGLRTVYITHHSDAPYHTYQAIRGWSLGIATAMICIGATIFGSSPATLWIISCTKAVESISDLSLGPGQKYGQLGTVAIRQIIGSASSLSAFIFTLIGTGNSILALATYGTVLAVATVAFVEPAGRKIAQRGESSMRRSNTSTKSLLIAGISQGFTLSLITLATAIPQYALAHSPNKTQLVTFAALMYTGTFVELIGNATMQAWSPTGVRIFRERGQRQLRQAARREFTKWQAIFLPASVLGVLFSLFGISTIYGADYKPDTASALLVGLNMLLVAPLYITAALVTILNRYTSAAIVSVVTLLVMVSSVILLNTLGLAGCLASVTLTLSFRILANVYLARPNDQLRQGILND